MRACVPAISRALVTGSYVVRSTRYNNYGSCLVTRVQHFYYVVM